MNKRILVLIPVVLIAAGGIYWYKFVRNGVPEGVLTVSGNIEITDSRVGFRIPGRMMERLVNEGDKLKAGQLVAKLDDSDQKLMVSQAEAKFAAANATLAELESGSRPQEVAGAKADLAKAESAEKAAASRLRLAEGDEKRFAELYKNKAVSQQRYDQYKTQYETASNALNEAAAAVRSAKEKLSLTVEGPRKEQIERAKAQSKLASEELSIARQQLEYTRLTAPFDGVVMSKSAEPGEYLAPGAPVVTIGNLGKVWLRAYVGETHLGRIKLGMDAEVMTDSFPGRKFTGKISFISSEAEFTPKSVQTNEERVKLMYRIKIDLDNKDSALKPGMPADAFIYVGKAPENGK